MRYLALGVPAVLLAVTLGCGDRKKTSETARVSDTSVNVTTPPVSDTAPVARDYSYAERQQFAQSIRGQLAELDSRIAELSKEAKSKGGAVSDKALERIRAARKTADRNLSKISSVSADKWEQVKLSTNRSVEAINDQIESAQPK
jgi:hypothetical protein